jgi:hypothetical protein
MGNSALKTKILKFKGIRVLRYKHKISFLKCVKANVLHFKRYEVFIKYLKIKTDIFKYY